MFGRDFTRHVIVVASIGLLIFITGQAHGQILRVFTVNTTSDTIVANACANGTAGCSLRGAITASNPNGDAIIQFNIPALDPFCSAGVCTINISSALPTVLGSNTTIAGPGAASLIIRPATGVATRVLSVNANNVTISGVTISNGQGTSIQAGGITHESGILTILDTVLSNNRGGAGAVFVGGGLVNIVRSTLVGNSANLGSGGGVRAHTNCNIINSTIVSNHANSDGGGVFASATAVNITNSTIAMNNASFSFAPNGASRGGGVRANGGLVTVKNTLIAGNMSDQGPDVSGNFTSAGFNLVGKTNTGLGFTAPTDLTGTIASPLDARLDPSGLQYRGGSTPTLAVLADSPAIDRGSNSGLTGILTTDQRSTGFPRTRDNPLVVNAVGGNGTDIGAYERHTYSTFDFEGDGRTDLGIFRPNGGEWWINRSLNGTTFALQFGASTDRIAPADFTGDGKTDIAFWRPGTGQWFVLRSEDFSFFAFGFGTNGDVPAPGDYDGDRKADAAVFRPSTGTWFILKSTGPLTVEQFGSNGDVPVAADYDGDGRADIAIFRPSNGQWWLNRSTAGVTAYTFGSATDKVVPADYTGDNKTDVAFWRPSNGNWLVLRSEDSSFYGFAFGVNGDVPAPGDYDGDGKADATIFRPSIGTWFSQRSVGGFAIQQFGANGDRPLPSAFIP